MPSAERVGEHGRGQPTRRPAGTSSWRWLDGMTDRSNESLGADEVAMIRDLNQRLGDAAFTFKAYPYLVRELVAHRTLTRRTDVEKLRLPDQMFDWATELSQRWIDDVESRGYSLIGSMDELLPLAGDRGDFYDPDDVAVERRLDVTDAFDALLTEAGMLHLELTDRGAAGQARGPCRGARARPARRAHARRGRRVAGARPGLPGGASGCPAQAEVHRGRCAQPVVRCAAEHLSPRVPERTVMTERTYVHIGPLKTGTTFVQNVLWKNKPLLDERGVLLPRKNAAQHVRSVLSVMGKVVNPDDTRDLSGAWPTMAEAITAWDGPAAVISQEFLCEAKPPVVERLVDDLAGVEVHVVYTARDLTKLIPAMWQTHLRNKFAPTSWQEYIASVRDPAAGTEPWGERFWHQQDPANVLGRWGTRVPAERIHVVTVPPSGADPSLLWRRFAGVVGIADPEAFDLELDRSNTSLGAVECEALRRVNLMVSGRIPGLAYQDLVKNMVAREILEQEPNEQRLALPASDIGWVRARAKAAQDFFATGGFDVVGDLSDLDPPSPSLMRRRPTTCPRPTSPR